MISIADRGHLPAHENINHYRVTGLWRVVSVNGGHAVVENVYGNWDGKEKSRELWTIQHHRWFDATELYQALCP